jgi:AcrR family transcriptional regulator
MKESSGIHSHMTNVAILELEPRKTPQQSRSVMTVQAIYDATIQVLLKAGHERLTTVRVAERAGVSVGTLYQYFPNKQSLLFAVLEQHMDRVTSAVEEVCAENHFEPLEVMVTELVNRFVDAKLTDRDTSVALYRIAAEPGGNLIVDRIRLRYENAMLAMFQTARMSTSVDLKYMTHIIFLTLAGIIRGHLESSPSPKAVRQLREHLCKLILAYCETL